MIKNVNEVKEKVDITNLVCPQTFVKVKVVLEDLESGDVLEVRLNDGEAIQNVPRSLKGEDHKVISVNNNNDGTYTLLVVKDGLIKE